MKTPSYSIAFNFQLENSNFFVPLTADVEVHHSETYYVVKNFKGGSHRQDSVLPDLIIKKKKGRWIHVDSGKESLLSIQVGKCIEGYERESG